MAASNTLEDMSPTGRPPRGEKPASTVSVRFTDDEREQYRRAAAATTIEGKDGERRPMTLAEWIRAACAAYLGAKSGGSKSTAPPKKGRPK